MERRHRRRIGKLGKTQQSILNVLKEKSDTFAALTITSLAAEVGCSERQCRTAAKSLDERGLIVFTPPQPAMAWLPENYQHHRPSS